MKKMFIFICIIVTIIILVGITFISQQSTKTMKNNEDENNQTVLDSEKEKIIGIQISANSSQYLKPETVTIIYDQKTETTQVDLSNLIVSGQDQENSQHQIRSAENKTISQSRFAEICAVIEKNINWLIDNTNAGIGNGVNISITFASQKNNEITKEVLLTTGNSQSPEQRNRFKEITQKIAEIIGRDITNIAEYD